MTQKQPPKEPQSPRNKVIAGAATATIGALGLFLSRWHGGGFISGSPKLLKAFLWSLIPAIASGLALYWPHQAITDGLQDRFLYLKSVDFALLDWIWLPSALIVLLLSMLTKNTGHGRGMSMGSPMKAGSKPEKLEYLVLWLQPHVSTYWYKFTIMSVIGLARALPAGAALTVAYWPTAFVMLLGAAGTPLSYAAGWQVYPTGGKKGSNGSGNFDEATEIGEAGSGLTLYLAAAISLIIIMVHYNVFTF